MPHLQTAQSMVGRSGAMLGVRRLIDRFAPYSVPVLIQGETGVGKELVARAIHEGSGRRGAFVAVNVCAIPDTIFEDTLFGHVNGAFTGAAGARDGLVRLADGGTLFLDEIGDLEPARQATLLRLLGSGEYRQVGADVLVRSRFRLVTATNRDLRPASEEGAFREDLFHRISGCIMSVPPLRERLEDLPLLLEHFAATFEEPGYSFPAGAVAILGGHDWPGNIRELEQVAVRAMVLSDTPVVGVPAVIEALEPTGAALLPSLSERAELERLLGECDWDPDRVAERRDCSSSTIYRAMRRLGIETRTRRARRANGKRNGKRNGTGSGPGG